MYLSYYFIVNARISKNDLLELKDCIQTSFQFDRYEFRLTEYPGHARELAQEAVDKVFDVAVAVGGDGTINEVMQSIVHSETALGIIPCGSGNGLARHLGISRVIHEALLWVRQGHTVRADVGRVNGRYFLSNAGVGIDAVVCKNIRNAWFRGFFMYFLYVSRYYLTYTSRKYKIRIDDGEEFTQRGYFLNVANGSEFGYRFQIAPNASILDHQLDVVAVPRLFPFQIPKFLWDGFTKGLRKNGSCKFYSAKRVEIRHPKLKWYQVDGDANDCDGFCFFEIEPESLRLIIPIVPKR
jgi:diacylglycerol kinase (ATP)